MIAAGRPIHRKRWNPCDGIGHASGAPAVRHRRTDTARRRATDVTILAGRAGSGNGGRVAEYAGKAGTDLTTLIDITIEATRAVGDPQTRAIPIGDPADDPSEAPLRQNIDRNYRGHRNGGPAPSGVRGPRPVNPGRFRL